MVSLEFFPKRVLGTIMLNPHPFADEIKRHPEVETLLITRDNPSEVTKEVITWLMAGVNWGRCSLPLNIPPICLIRASAVETVRAHNLKVTGSSPAPATEWILRAPPGEVPFCS